MIALIAALGRTRIGSKNVRGLSVNTIRINSQKARIYQDVLYAAELATISWVSTGMLTAEWRGHAGSVDVRSIPYDLVVFAQPTKYRVMGALPNACLHPERGADASRPSHYHTRVHAADTPRVFQSSARTDSVRAARSLMRGRPPLGDGAFTGS